MPTFEQICLKAGSGPNGVIKTITDVEKYYPEVRRLATANTQQGHIEGFRQRVGSLLTLMKAKADQAPLCNDPCFYTTPEYLAFLSSMPLTATGMKEGVIKATIDIMGFGNTIKEIGSLLEDVDKDVVTIASRKFLYDHAKFLISTLAAYDPTDVSVLMASYADYEAYAIFSPFTLLNSRDARQGSTKLQAIAIRRIPEQS